MNEIAYIAFDGVTVEYHDEQDYFIGSMQYNYEFRQGMPTIAHRKIDKHGNQQTQQIVLSEYIRHQIHHKDNNLDIHYPPRSARNPPYERKAMLGQISTFPTVYTLTVMKTKKYLINYQRLGEKGILDYILSFTYYTLK